MNAHLYSANEVISIKRDGGKLNAGQLKWFIDGLINGKVQEYHASALLMAIYLNGCDSDETAYLTEAMLHSGQVLDFQDVRIVDKHSTGGVGDKTSLILGPIAAAAGVRVPMISGRGLGHTGGTIDKLESIPGFCTDFKRERFLQIFNRTGLIICGQSDDFAPADKILYQLRDRTGTVASVPLITSSIMSKKLAEGTQGLVMDIKVGAGAFMKTREEAQALARSLRSISSSFRKNIMTMITDMSQPLGQAVGNANEVIESIETLKGNGPSDVTTLSVELAAGMIFLARIASTKEEAKTMAWNELHSGRALKKFEEMISAQGGNAKVITDYSLFNLAKNDIKVTAPATGFLNSIDVCRVGHAICRLGGGRMRPGDKIDHGVGVSSLIRIGQFVQKGETMALIHCRAGQEELAKEIAADLTIGYRIGAARIDAPNLILEVQSDLV